jgi:hypothetical protein
MKFAFKWPLLLFILGLIALLVGIAFKILHYPYQGVPLMIGYILMGSSLFLAIYLLLNPKQEEE